MIVFAKDSTAQSWVEDAAGSEFPIQNLPFGVFEHAGRKRAGAAIGGYVLDLAALEEAGIFNEHLRSAERLFATDTLNRYLASGREMWSAVRRRVISLLAAENVALADGTMVEADRRLRDDKSLREAALVSREEVRMHLPCEIGNFVDFYSSKEHASNVGAMFRDPQSPLLPNWVHLPIGYNGRSSSIVVSGTDVRRPCGQTKADDADAPTFGPTRLLDFELETGFITGPGNALGSPIPAGEAPQHIFGMVLVNDWSARDIQKWEYVPLGPFLGKSFTTSISPWVVTLDALAPFRVPGPKQDPPVLPYLQARGDWGLDIQLEVLLQSGEATQPHCLARTNLKHMYWSIVQQLAHVTSNGTNVLPGDLYASGTVSGPTPDSYGSMLELAWRGTKPITLPDGQQRKFIADGDTVIMRGRCEAEGFCVGFGEVRGKVLPART